MADKIATREAYGNALAEFGSDSRIVVFDADLSKSTKVLVVISPKSITNPVFVATSHATRERGSSFKQASNTASLI